MAEDWHWRAHYNDGQVLDEHADDGTVSGFADIDQSRLVALELLPQRDGLPTPHVRITDGLIPTFFRRRSIVINAETEEQEPGRTIAVLGWKKNVGGRKVLALTFWFPDGSCLISDDPDAAY